MSQVMEWAGVGVCVSEFIWLLTSLSTEDGISFLMGNLSGFLSDMKNSINSVIVVEELCMVNLPAREVTIFA
jgi:hypothetical protein